MPNLYFFLAYVVPFALIYSLALPGMDVYFCLQSLDWEWRWPDALDIERTRAEKLAPLGLAFVATAIIQSRFFLGPITWEAILTMVFGLNLFILYGWLGRGVAGNPDLGFYSPTLSTRIATCTVLHFGLGLILLYGCRGVFFKTFSFFTFGLI